MKRASGDGPVLLDADEYGNRSVVVGFSVLKGLLAIGRAASLGEIAATMKMTGSRTHRFLAGLEKVGAVSHDRETGKYNLGPLLIRLGAGALSQVDTIRLGTEALNELAQETDLVAILCSWDSNGPTVTKWTQGSRTTALHVHEGTSLALLTTSAGQIFLSFLPREKTAGVLEAEIERSAENGKIWKPAEVEKLIATVRERGVSFSRGKAYPSLIAVSSPVFDWNGELVLSLTIIGDSRVVNMKENSELVGVVKMAAETLSRRIGHHRARAQKAG